MADELRFAGLELDVTARPIDVTDRLARPDEKPENRIYRTPEGHHVKVKTWQVAGVQAGIDNYFMSGSLCDANGTALTDETGTPLIIGMGEGIGVTELWRSNPKTKAEQIEDARASYVLVLERVAKSRAAEPPAGVAKASIETVMVKLAASLKAPEQPLADEVAATRTAVAPMPVFDGAEAARAMLRTFDREPGFDALSDDLRARLLTAAVAMSAVDAVCQMAELIYARRDQVTGSLLSLGAGLAALAATHGWQGMGADGRGAAISAALRRDAGEAHPIPGMSWPDPNQDPAALPEHLPLP